MCLRRVNREDSALLALTTCLVENPKGQDSQEQKSGLGGGVVSYQIGFVSLMVSTTLGSPGASTARPLSTYSIYTQIGGE